MKELFITKNPKSWGSFDPSIPLVCLRERKTGDLVGLVWTTKNVSFNRYGGTNYWECSYLYLVEGYKCIEGDDARLDSDPDIRLWNRGLPLQVFHSPKYCGEQKYACICKYTNEYVDVYAEVADVSMYTYGACCKYSDTKGVDLFYQRWGHGYNEVTLKARLKGQYLPKDAEGQEVIVYSRKGEYVITAYWDNIDHVMSYSVFRAHQDITEEIKSHFCGIYKVYTDSNELWKDFEESATKHLEEEAPDVEEEAFISPFRPPRRTRAQAKKEAEYHDVLDTLPESNKHT